MPVRAQCHPARPLAFRVRFRGVLDASWFANLLNVALSSSETGNVVVTTLIAEAPDEAALMGVLNLLYGLGCPLISLECSDWGTVDHRPETPSA
jgi:hypothetical protein